MAKPEQYLIQNQMRQIKKENPILRDSLFCAALGNEFCCYIFMTTDT